MAGMRMQDMSRSLMMKMPLDPGFRLYMASVVSRAEAATVLTLKRLVWHVVLGKYLPLLHKLNHY